MLICSVQVSSQTVPTSKMRQNNKLTALSISLNVILLITAYRQACQVYKYVPRPTAIVTFESQSVILSTEESLYAMYGEGNFTDHDRQLLNYIRSMTSQQGSGGRHLAEPSRIDFSQFGGARFVDRLLRRRRNGYFVECGAFRGEDLSDTLFFELQRNWTGILVEPHPEYHREILRKNRRALVLRACLSSSRRPALVKFKLAGWGSGVSALNKNVRLANQTISETRVQCFSLNSIMAAIGVRHIDFMVLDVEGSELPVLQSIDWTRLSIDIFSIEYSEHSRRRTMKKLNKIRHFFNKTGQVTGHRYKEVGILPLGAKEYLAQDVIFMRV